ncbi:Kinesin- protein 12, partial [Blyttiomyces sp. JEL0837]
MLTIYYNNRYNATIFAFGQTGSGKTHTITGPPEQSPDCDVEETTSFSPGIIPRSLEYLFSHIESLRASSGDDTQYTIRAAYLEIYNEQVQDLLNPGSASLAVRWSADRGFYVDNLFVVECEVLEDCLAVLEEGLRNRTTGSHRLNDKSSRSHSIMAIYIDCKTINPDDGAPVVKHGKLSFVDLAGSEKVKESRASGETLTETMNINKSLLTLGNCISALSDRRKRFGHIPYRDSKLTRLLSDSLGGTGYALMFACVSPSSFNLHETLKTLRYAQRAKKIKNRPVVQIDPVRDAVLQLRRE